MILKAATPIHKHGRAKSTQALHTELVSQWEIRSSQKARSDGVVFNFLLHLFLIGLSCECVVLVESMALVEFVSFFNPYPFL